MTARSRSPRRLRGVLGMAFQSTDVAGRVRARGRPGRASAVRGGWTSSPMPASHLDDPVEQVGAVVAVGHHDDRRGGRGVARARRTRAYRTRQVLDDGAGRGRVEVRDRLVEEHDRAAAERGRGRCRAGPARRPRGRGRWTPRVVSSPSGSACERCPRPAAVGARARPRRRRRRAGRASGCCAASWRRRGSRRRRRRCAPRVCSSGWRSTSVAAEAGRCRPTGRGGGRARRAGSTCRCRWAR